MPDRESQRKRVRQLLAQDPYINDEQLKEFRMTLESNLTAWEHRAAQVRRWLVRSVALLVLGYFGTIFSMISYQSGVEALGDTWWRVVYGAIPATFALAGFVAFVATIWLGIAYFVKYAPALRRARYDVQTSMILQLQEQIAQLRADLQLPDKH